MGQREGVPDRGSDPPDGDSLGTLHLRIRVQLVTVLGAIGAVCAFIVLRWEQVEPVLTSLPAAVALLIVNFFLGGGWVYWLVARPALLGREGAEGVIKGLRKERDEFYQTIADMKAMIASLEAEVRHLKEYVERLEDAPSPVPGASRTS